MVASSGVLTAPYSVPLRTLFLPTSSRVKRRASLGCHWGAIMGYRMAHNRGLNPGCEDDEEHAAHAHLHM